MPDNIDELLFDWEFDPYLLNVRRAKGSDGREILQMRIDMGVIQMEITGRPDGEKPGGFSSIHEQLESERKKFGDEFVLSEENLLEIDREFVQFYHRRICWLQLREFENAVQDADQTLALMDFCQEVSDNEDWVLSHEQYRPFVLFHRTQAASLSVLESEDTPENSIHEINLGLERLRDLYKQYEVEEDFENEELVQRLLEMREDLREKYNIGKTLHEQLDEAVASEQYERAASIRDKLARRKPGAI